MARRKKRRRAPTKASLYGYKPSGAPKKKRRSKGSPTAPSSSFTASSYGNRPSGRPKRSRGAPTAPSSSFTASSYGNRPSGRRVTAGPKLSESSTVSRRSLLRKAAREQAKRYRAKELFEFYQRFAEKDEEGRIKTKTEKVSEPVLKANTNERKVAAELKEFERKVEQIRAKESDPATRKQLIAREWSRVARRNFKLDKRGRIKYRERKVTVPVLKRGGRTAIFVGKGKNRKLVEGVPFRKAQRMELERIRRRTRQIARKWEPGDREYPTLKEYMRRRARADAKAEAKSNYNLGSLIRDVLGQATEAHRKAPVAFAGLTGINRPDIQIPTRTGVMYLLDYLSRPSAAVQTALGKALVKAGAIKGDTAKKIARAPDPFEAFKRGYTDPKVVTGGDVTEGLFGVREAGIVSEIAFDPLMWFGLGGLRAGQKAARSAAKRTARIERYAPERLRTGRFRRLALEAERTGDFSELDRYLKKVEQHALTPLQRRRPVPLAGRRVRRRSTEERNQELLDAARRSLAEAPKVGGERFALPGKALTKAISEVARSAAAQRRLGPGLRLRIMTPFGREIGGVNLPLPGRLPVPTALSRRARYLAASRREQEYIARNLGPIAESRKALRKSLEEARRAQDAAKAREINYQLRQLDDHEAQLRQLAREQANAPRLPFFERLDDLIERINSRRQIHETFRVSAHFARQLEQDAQRALARAIKPIQDNKDSLLAVSLYRMAKQDHGSPTFFTRQVRPLTETERRVVADLERLDESVGHHGLEIGTLDTMIDNYVTRLWQRTGDPAGTIDPKDLRQDFPAMGRTPGSTPFFARHREQPEMGSLADPEVLAEAIRRVAGRGMTHGEARKLADQWHRLGRIRSTIERLARALQRGNITLHMDELTDLERQAIAWERHMARQQDEEPLFLVNRESDSLQLNPKAVEDGPFDPEALAGIDAQSSGRASLHSALVDRAELQEAIELSSGATRAAYEKMAARLDREIEQLTDRAGLRDDVPEFRRVKAGHYVSDEGLEITREGRTWYLRRNGDVLAQARTLKAVRAQVPRGPSPLLERARQRYFEIAGRGPQSFDEPLVPGAPGHYGDGRSDPFDFTGRLDDVRGGIRDAESANLFPVLDPRVSSFYRTRVEGIQSALRARWQGLDEAAGRSLQEARGKVYTDADGNRGLVAELVALRDSSGRLIGWRRRGTDEEFGVDEIDIPDDALIPNRDETIFYDPRTGDEYMRPADKDPVWGNYVQQIIGEDRLWPARMIEDVKMEMLRQGEQPVKEIYETGMEHLYGRTMALIRYGVTTPFPAYHVRNMISDLLKSLQADSGILFHPVMAAKLLMLAVRRGRVGTVRTPFKDRVVFGKRIPGLEFRYRDMTFKVPGFPKRLKAEEFLFVMDLFGVRSSQHLAEYLRIASQGRTISKGRRRTVSLFGPEGAVGKAMIELGARREDIMRFITFTQRLRRNGGDLAEAAWYMTKHHFDYADLTAFERRVVRNIFLFYTWYRRNIPLQFMEMITRPGFFSGVANTYYALAEGETPLNVDWSQLHPILPDMSGPIPIKGVVPDHLIQQLGAVVMNWNDHTFAFAFGAPWVDMNLIANLLTTPKEVAGQLVSMLNPAITIPFQLIAGKEPLTLRDFKKYEPLAEEWVPLLKRLGFDIKRDPETRGPLIHWVANVILRNIPFAGRASSYMIPRTSVMDTGRVASNRAIASLLGGLNIYMSPSRRRLPALWFRLTQARAGERRAFSESISNLKESDKKREMRKFDRETLRWAREHNIPRSFLETIPALGFYKPRKPRRAWEFDYGLGRKFDLTPDRSGKNALPVPEFGLDSRLDSFDDFKGFGGEPSGPRKWKPKTPREKRMVGKQPKRKQVKVPSGVPKAYRKVIARHGPKLDEVAKRYGLTGVELMAKTFKGESGFNMKAVSSAGARGAAQFTPGTRQAVLQATNGRVDPWRSPDEAARAMVMHMTGQLGHAKGLEGYNPGGGQAYVNYILSQDVGTGSQKVKVPKPLPGPYKGAKRAVLRVLPKGVRAEGRGDKRTPAENAAVDGSPTSDHLTTNKAAYAADIPGTLDDGKTDQIAKQIAKNLGLPSHRGTNEVIKDGYRYQLIWQDDGHYDHIHLGAHWVGDGDSAPSSSSGGYGLPSLSGQGPVQGTTNPEMGPLLPKARNPVRQLRRFQRRFLPPLEQRIGPQGLAENIRLADEIDTEDLDLDLGDVDELLERLRKREYNLSG